MHPYVRQVIRKGGSNRHEKRKRILSWYTNLIRGELAHVTWKRLPSFVNESVISPWPIWSLLYNLPSAFIIYFSIIILIGTCLGLIWPLITIENIKDVTYCIPDFYWIVMRKAQENSIGFYTVGDAQISAYALICLLITDKLSNNVAWKLRNLC